MFKSLSPLSVTLSLFIAVATAACAHQPTPPPPHGETSDSGFYNSMLGFYSGPLNHLNGVRRGSCPMHPSCSQYSRQAVARYGLLKGWVMTMDRLMRCGRDELKISPRIYARGDWRHYDPIDRNLWSQSKPDNSPAR